MRCAGAGTPNGEWRVEVIRTRNGEVFRVRWRAVIGAHGGRGRAPIAHLRGAVAEVAELLVDARSRITPEARRRFGRTCMDGPAARVGLPT